MALPSFSQFEWLHPQPSWGFEPDYRTAIRTARFERWAPLWKLLLLKPGFSDYEIGALLRLKDEYDGGVGRRG
jgi:hypothetical protein